MALDRAADAALAALGAPDVGVVLGSGWQGIAEALRVEASLRFRDLHGFPSNGVDGHGDGIVSCLSGSRRAWLATGRLHLYEGHDAATVATTVRLFARAGARKVVLTCAAGGLADAHRPGDLVLVSDQLNLTGADPTRGRSVFADMHDAYDPALLAIWRETAARHRVAVAEGVLASVAGPSFETPAEVRMLRMLGADLVSMSVAVETIAARSAGLRVAAIACVANRGAGLGDRAPIDHDGVLAVVAAAVRGKLAMLLDGIEAVAAAP